MWSTPTIWKYQNKRADYVTQWWKVVNGMGQPPLRGGLALSAAHNILLARCVHGLLTPARAAVLDLLSGARRRVDLQ